MLDRERCLKVNIQFVYRQTYTYHNKYELHPLQYYFYNQHVYFKLLAMVPTYLQIFGKEQILCIEYIDLQTYKWLS